jgi:anthranilate phosphoribosyltransferase
MKEALLEVLQGKSLDRIRAFNIMDQICLGHHGPEVTGKLLLALKTKSESIDEIVGFVQSLRAQARTVPSLKKNIMDVCGTGGDNLGTFNVSTTVAFVAAASGQPIAKHGSRSVSSKSGSFDVLEALGIKFSDDSDKINQSLEKYNLGFLFAPAFHPALKQLATLRKSLGVPTIFNLLGPLLNPIPVKRQIIGVYDSKFLEKISLALKALGSEEVMVVHGEDGLDEFSISGPTLVAHLKNGEVKNFVVTPEDCGLKRYPIEELKGGTAAENAQILINILKGEKGAKRDAVLLNTGAALAVGGLASNIKEGVQKATVSIDSGRSLRLLQMMRESL